jgi:hypothetical protein
MGAPRAEPLCPEYPKQYELQERAASFAMKLKLLTKSCAPGARGRLREP